MRVHLYSICWNEARMLPFFFRHYDAFVDRYVIYDDGSTDGTREMLAAHPKVELRRFRREVPDSYVQSARLLHDRVWKESRGAADWVVMTPVDEHLTHPDMAGLWAECRRHGVTAIPALGFQMVAERFPAAPGRLATTLRRGAPYAAMNKLSSRRWSALPTVKSAGGRPWRSAYSGEMLGSLQASGVSPGRKHSLTSSNAPSVRMSGTSDGRAPRTEGVPDKSYAPNTRLAPMTRSTASSSSRMRSSVSAA